MQKQIMAKMIELQSENMRCWCETKLTALHKCIILFCNEILFFHVVLYCVMMNYLI